MSDAAPIAVTVRLFAMLRERAGTGSLELRLAPGATVEDALARLATECSLGELLDRLPIRAAVNREYAAPEQVLAAGDELALIPPVSGGAPGAGEGMSRLGGGASGAGEGVSAFGGDASPSGGGTRVHAAVSGQPLSADALRELVAAPAAGAIVTFEGVTREVEVLDYEAYEEMALERIERVLALCVERHGLCAAAAAHRTGRVPLGEPSVIVAVSAAHRVEAFAGAREVIDEIKAQAPIWKREARGAGVAEWVQGTPAPEIRDEAAEAGLRTPR